MTKYLAQINLANNGGTYVMCSDSLDEIRDWAKAKGRNGDTLFIMKNGDKIGNGRIFEI